MIEIRYLQAESGANKFGTCNCCGKSSGEDPLMISVKFSYYGHGTLICLCDDCKKKLMEVLPPANCSESPNTSDCISRQQAIRWVKTECNPYGKPTLDFESGKKVIEHLEQMPPAHEPLTDKEQRIFLAAMERERKICKEVDDQYTHEPYEILLTKVCNEIERKVKKALWS